MVTVGTHKLDNSEVDFVNELGGGKSSTGKRIFSELNSRIENLTREQLELLVRGDLNAQKQIAFLAVCKTYDFIRDFTVEVLREKMLVFDYEITEGDFISFYRRKTDLYPEMEKLTDLTQKKQLEKEMETLKKKIRKEKQFNKKVELNKLLLAKTKEIEAIAN
jgi:hypothetical protein